MRLQLIGFILFMMLWLPSEVVAQQDTIVKTKKKAESSFNRATFDLQQSLDSNDESEIANNYEKLADEFILKGDYAKAEEYLKKALTSYTKLNRTVDKTRVTRNLAKSQESQKKIGNAIKNYEAAGKIAQDKESEKINSNDAKRLKYNSNPKVKEILVDQNIDLLEKKNKREEVADAYVQKAENSLAQQNSETAIESYKQAISYAKDKPEKIIKIKTDMAKIYVSENQFDKAISISEKLLEEAKIKQDFDTQITQLQSLASIYFKKENPEKAIESLKLAYEIASQSGKTAQAKNTLTQLISYYKAKGNESETLVLYEKFFKDFDQLIQADTSLIDAKTFQITEQKIQQLEKEKALKDELIDRKNTFNYFLLGSILLLLSFSGLIVKAFYSIKKKNKEIALQSLRREMNPHFIFNSLNSVNQFISQNKELEANKYLTSYSNLMRNSMENSNKDFVTLSNEIDHLTKYLDLEHLRFQDNFDYTITVDETIDTETTFIPNMIIQPHLENAIWHGLRYLDHKGLLKLVFKLNAGQIAVIIEDNGIGLEQSQKIKTQNQKVHQSRGLTNTKERISLLNDLYKQQIVFEMSEKQKPETGTIVSITFPQINTI